MDSKEIRSDKLDLCNKCGKMFLKTGTTNLCPRCLGEKYPSRVGEESRRPDTFEIERRKSSKDTNTTEKDKKWSQKFERCVKCGGNDVKHIARGLCLNCYQRETEKRSRGRKGQKQGEASQRMTFKFLLENYIERKRSLIDIAKECGCSRQSVFKKMKKFNIPLRTLKEARQLAYDRNKLSYTIMDQDGTERLITQGSIKINENFFLTWSKEMAYVLGLLYTDGNLFHDIKRKTYRIVMSQKQPELLDKMLKLMDCDARLRHRKKRGISGEVYFFDIQQKQVYSDLISLGLSANKSRTIEFPNIPPEFVRHFIRGCWDGDGSIYFDSGRLRASYTCGSFKFIEKLVQELYRAEIYKRRPPSDKSERDKMLSNYPDGSFPLKIHEEKRSKSYYIKIDSNDSLDKLFHYLYDNVDESIYLTRKHNAFITGLKLEERSQTEQLTLNLDF
jgi:predicted DNA-binding protein YlxM (UPF0122 family)